MSLIPTPPKTGNSRLDEFLNEVYTSIRKSFFSKIYSVATDYTLLKSDYYVGVTDTTLARTITLPPLRSLEERKVYIVKDESGGAAANNITIDADSAETIDGGLTTVISSNYGVVRLIKNGSNWFTW
ncbi:MAG: hypothetical protein AB7O96_01050 [Pseudobdellovibrionaceae bacterium]